MKRDIEGGETIEIQIDPNGLWTSDAVDFSIFNKAKMEATNELDDQ